MHACDEEGNEENDIKDANTLNHIPLWAQIFLLPNERTRERVFEHKTVRDCCTFSTILYLFTFLFSPIFCVNSDFCFLEKM